MQSYCRITVCYKYASDLETLTYWQYNDPFPMGWIWISEETRGNETFEYFEGPTHTEKEMISYISKKFSEFQTKKQILYFKIFT